MAHSDIFLCGQSNDAMLATRLYSVIKGSCQAFFLEQLDLPENILTSLGWSDTLMQVQPKQGTGPVQRPFYEAEKNVCGSSQEWTTIDRQKQTQIS